MHLAFSRTASAQELALRAEVRASCFVLAAAVLTSLAPACGITGDVLVLFALCRGSDEW